MKTISTEFSDRLTEFMQEYNLSNLALEKIVGCKNQSVSSWLTKGVYPRVGNLLKLSDYFHCSIDYLLGLSNCRDNRRTQNDVDIHDRLQQLIVESQSTRYSIAKSYGINASSFINWKKRNLTPDTLTLIKLCNYFNCSFDYIIGISNFSYIL